MKTSLIFVRVIIYFLAISALSLTGCAETAKNVDNAEKKDNANLYPDSLTDIQKMYSNNVLNKKRSKI